MTKRDDGWKWIQISTTVPAYMHTNVIANQCLPAAMRPEYVSKERGSCV